MGGRLLPVEETRPGLYRVDSRSSTGESLQKRSSVQVEWIDLEFGQGESEGSNPCPKPIIGRLYRDVVIGCLRDLGCGDFNEANAVVRWMNSESFGHCCTLADWEEDWLIDVFKSVASIPLNTRSLITKECLEMLRSLARLKLIQSDSGNSMFYTVSCGAHGFANPSRDILNNSTPEFDFARESKLGKMSKARHQLKAIEKESKGEHQ